MKETIASLLARLARHGLSALGALLASKGIITHSGQIALTNLADVIYGLVLFGIGILWSWASDKLKFGRK